MARHITPLLILACLVLGLVPPPMQVSAGTPINFNRAVFFGPEAFHPASSNCPALISNQGLTTNAPTGGCTFTAPLFIPTHTLVTDITYFFIDNDDSPAGFLSFDLTTYNPITQVEGSRAYRDTSGQAASSNVRTLIYTFDTPMEIDNANNAYELQVTLPTGATKFKFYGARVNYRLSGQIYPVESQYVTLRGSSLLPTNADIRYTSVGTGLGLTQLPTTAPSIAHFAFPLPLPASATLQELRAWYVDNTSETLSLLIGQFDPSNGACLWESEITSPGPADGGVLHDAATTDITHSSVVSGKQAILYYKPGAVDHSTTQHRLYAVRVKYLPATLPASMLTLSGYDFRPINSVDRFTNNGGWLHANTEGSRYRVNFHLPDNAAIRRITLYVHDQSPSTSDIQFHGIGYKPLPLPASTLTTPIVSSASLQDSANVQALDLPARALGAADPFNRYYTLEAYFTDNYMLDFVGAVIEYYDDHPVYLPAVTK